MANLITDEQARMIISIAGEPGDEKVGAMVGEFGPIRAIEMWSNGIGPDAMCKSIRKVKNSPLVTQAIKSLNAVRGRFITPSNAEWPKQLIDLDLAAPIGLWCVGNGNLQDLTQRSIAVVGARSATAYGERIATDIGAMAAASNITTISGAAYGIDAAAHRGSIAANGATVAVLACGVDVAYPQAHRGLLTRISEAGLIVSEAPPGARPYKHRFLTRNRLIAAFAQSTVVVEAALRSGSLSTSNWANVLGREVWGIPGPLSSATSAGVHAGIQARDMKLVAEISDVIKSLIPTPDLRLGLVEGAIVGLIQSGSETTSALLARTAGELDSHDLYAALSILELQGVITSTSTGWKVAK